MSRPSSRRPTPGRFIPGLQDLPISDRRRVVERLLRRARRCLAERAGVVAVLAHGEVAGEPNADVGDVPIRLLVVVESEADPDAVQELGRYFSDLTVEIDLTIESRAGFRKRAESGEAELAGIRDRAVLLAGSLPVEYERPW